MKFENDFTKEAPGVWNSFVEATISDKQDANGELKRRLFRAAIQGLHAEDVALSHAFQQAPPTAKTLHANTSFGLAYWVFETTLVYTIFKSWLPIAPVRWEHPYARQVAFRNSPRTSDDGMDDRPNCRADLVVFQDEKDDQSPRYAFEAKWWNYSTTKTLNGLNKDCTKLRGWTATELERFLITFWYGRPSAWQEEWSQANEYLGKNEGLTVEYAAAFPTNWCLLGESERQGYFTMAVLKVG